VVPCRPAASIAALERAARLFHALGDAPRLRLLELLMEQELCVTEIVAATKEKFSTVSQRLRLLRSESLVVRRRQGIHVFYGLADRHVAELLHNALAHASELTADPLKGAQTMDHHQGHTHKHGADCGHTAIQHGDHVDYLHDGHMHHMGKAGVEEHQLPVGKTNPAQCTPKHDCGKHDKKHKHGPKCGHEAVPHGDHVDYLVDGHLHHPHGDHCDDHGKVEAAK